MGRWLSHSKDLKAITALYVAANLLNCTHMTYLWLPWTEGSDPIRDILRRSSTHCFYMWNAFFEATDKDDVFNERMVKFLKTVVLEEGNLPSAMTIDNQRLTSGLYTMPNECMFIVVWRYVFNFLLGLLVSLNNFYLLGCSLRWILTRMTQAILAITTCKTV